METEATIRERLGSQSGWLRSLAQALAKPGEADDLAQQAMLAALERPPAIREEAGLRAWLTVVVRNMASKSHRVEANRRAREERTARGEAVPSSEAVVSQAASSRMVVRALMELEEPYRSALILRYYEGHSPRQIAELTGSTPGAVRTRLSRAVAALRVKLTAQSDGDPQVWLTALAPLLQPTGWGPAAVAAKSPLVAWVAAAALVAAVGLLWRAATSTPYPTGSTPVSLLALSPESASTEISPLEAEANEPGTSAEVVREAPLQHIILAVDESTGRPVAGAEVFYAPRSEPEVAATRGNSDLEGALRRVGHRATTDGEGLASFPGDAYHAIVVRSGELCGTTHIVEGHSEPVTVALTLQRTIAIQVVDERGVPVAGVPVEIATVDPEQAHFRDSLWEGLTSGEEGLATLHQYESVRYGNYAGGIRKDLAEGKWVVARLDFPLEEPVEVGFAPDELPEKPLRLVKPPTGSMRIELVDAQGQPFGDDTWVYAEREIVTMGGSYRQPQRLGNWYAREGSLIVPHCGLGLELKVLAAPRGYREAKASVRGPGAEGQEADVRLQLEERLYALTGIALGEDRIPLAGRNLRLELEVQSGDRAQKIEVEAKTDQEGNFRFERESLDPRANLISLRSETDPHDEGAILMAVPETVPAHLPMDGAWGELHFQQAPIAVSGRVVDAEGEPLYWVLVDAFTSQSPENIQRRYDYNLRAYTRMDGTFDMVGDLQDGTWQIVASRDPFLPSTPIEVRPGMKDVEIVLHGSAQLSGSLRTVAGVDPTLLELEVRPKGAAPRSEWRRGTYTPKPDGSFHLTGLQPGEFDLYVHLDVESGPVGVVEGLLLEAEGECKDPRLAEIDLRGRVFPFSFEAVDAGGARLENALLDLRSSDGSQKRGRLVWLEDGEGVVLSAWPQVDIELRCPAYLPIRQENLSAGTQLTLEPGHSVLLRLPAEVELPPEPHWIRVNAVPKEIYWPDTLEQKASSEQQVYTEDSRYRRIRRTWDRLLSTKLGHRREGTIALPQEGTYVLELSLSNPEDPRGSDSLGAHTLIFREGVTSEHELQLSTETLRAAIGR